MNTSILVSMYNKNESVIKIIDEMFFPSLIRNSSHDKELIIIDDCSPLKQKTKELIQKYMKTLKSKFGRVVFSRNQTNLGFGGSYNRAIYMATGKNLIITNDDIYFPKNSIDSLVSALNNKKVGSVGPITGSRSVCTYQYCKQGPSIKSYSKKDFQNIEDFAVKIKKLMKGVPVKKTDILTGFCFATKKKIIDEIGGFDDKVFGYGYLEDTDLIRRIRQHYDVIISSGVYIHHGGIEGISVSFGQHPVKKLKSYLINCYKYARKWEDFSGIFILWIRSLYCYMGFNTVSDLVKERLESQTF